MKMYNKKFADIYDLLYSHKDYDKEVHYILSRGGRGTLLDVGAGTLSHSILLSNHFERILATDFSREMLEVGESKMKRKSIENIDVFCGGLDEISDSFDTIISMFNVVNHILTIAELKNFFESITRLLKPGGTFIFDVWGGLANILDPPMELTNRVLETNNGSITLDVNTTTCFKSLTAVMKMTATGIGLEVETKLKHRIWTMDVLSELADCAGLYIEENSDNYLNNDGFSEFSRKIVFVCKKK